jgi:hypothetical protein
VWFGAGVRDCSLFNVDLKRRKYPSVRCASAADDIDSDIDIFNGLSVWVNDWPTPDTLN